MNGHKEADFGDRRRAHSFRPLPVERLAKFETVAPAEGGSTGSDPNAMD
jgi:hypothetical protein